MNALITKIHPATDDRIAIDVFYAFLILWIEGDETAASMKTRLSLTQEEGDALDSFLAMAPSDIGGLSGLLATLAPLARMPKHQWATRVRGVLMASEARMDGYYEQADLEAKLGISPS